MDMPPDLVRRLKRLRLGGLLPTLPDRAAHARQAKLSPVEFLELLLPDEIDRRDSQGLTRRIEAAGFEEVVTAEQIVWDSAVSFHRPRVRELFGLHWLGQQENIIFTGPVGVGKSFLAQALGHSASCRAGHHVRYIKAAPLLHALHASRTDNSFARELRGWLAWDLLIVDDFGLRQLTAPQSSDLYDVLVERHRQPRGRGVGRPLRRSDPGQQRPRSLRASGASNRDGGAQPPRGPGTPPGQGRPPSR
jgi:DNA replication protein DnaC